MYLIDTCAPFLFVDRIGRRPAGPKPLGAAKTGLAEAIFCSGKLGSRAILEAILGLKRAGKSRAETVFRAVSLSAFRVLPLQEGVGRSFRRVASLKVWPDSRR